MSDELLALEQVAAEIIAIFEVKSPPVPIERMLQHPQDDMWEEVDIAQLSSGFLSLEDRYTPRMSLTRLLARQIGRSAWGRSRGLPTLLQSAEAVPIFARMLIMPAEMVQALSDSAREPDTMRLHFEVPKGDAQLRLDELATYL